VILFSSSLAILVLSINKQDTLARHRHRFLSSSSFSPSL